MIALLAKWLIPNRENTADAAVRRAYGQLCGFVALPCAMCRLRE